MATLIIKITTTVLTFTLIFSLSGCNALHTSLSKQDLAVQTKMSDSVFLAPTDLKNKIIYVDIKNTSTQPNFNIKDLVVNNLQKKGYRVTDRSDRAYYWLRANILSVDKTDPSAAETALNSGYGGAITGAAIGSAMGGVFSGWSGVGIGGLAGSVAFGLAEVVADALVHDTTYIVITDVEIAEQAKDGVIVRQDSQQAAKQGIGGGRTQTSSEITDKKQYRLRIVSTANKVNLDYQEAVPDLTNGLISSISGIF